MDNVKSENRDSVCSGCLSSDRHTSDIERQDLFVMLLSKQTLGYVESKYLNIQLCWECNAMLRKIALFQQKINEAQYILETSLHLGQIHSDLTTLSSLKISHNAEYDYAINYEEELLQRQTVEAQNLLQEHLTIEIVKKETEEHNDLSYDYDVKDEYSLSDSDAVNKKKEKKAMLGKFEKKAIITKNELDLKKLDKYFKKTVMDNCEMEDVLQKERDCKRGKSQYRYACKKCKIKYKRVMDVNRHCDFAHSLKTTPLHCSECNETCDTQSLLDNHWKTHNVLFKCMFCITYCRSKCEMNLHLINTHSRVYTCKNCGMQIYSSQQFTNHYKNYHTKFICDDCGRVFGIKRNLEKHMIKEHFPPFCQVCNRQFPKYHSLEVHYRNFHPELIYKTVKREESYCVECDRQFPSQYLYKRHLSTAVAHVQKAPVKIPCPECGKIFSRKTYMKNHYKLVHVRATSHYCEICNKHFVSGFSLRTHRKFVHEKTVKPKDKICDVCGRGFHTNRTLLNHKRTHTGERPYKCTYCPAAFAQSYARTTHERSQHKNISDVFILPT